MLYRFCTDLLFHVIKWNENQAEILLAFSGSLISSRMMVQPTNSLLFSREIIMSRRLLVCMAHTGYVDLIAPTIQK